MATGICAPHSRTRPRLVRKPAPVRPRHPRRRHRTTIPVCPFMRPMQPACRRSTPCRPCSSVWAIVPGAVQPTRSSNRSGCNRHATRAGKRSWHGHRPARHMGAHRRGAQPAGTVRLGNRHAPEHEHHAYAGRSRRPAAGRSRRSPAGRHHRPLRQGAQQVSSLHGDGTIDTQGWGLGRR